MTIPSIGGNDDFSNKIKPISHNAQQPVEQYTETVETPEQVQIQPESSPVEQPVEVIAQEKEYSIAQFKRDYTELLYSNVLPIIGQYEQERKQRLKWAILGATLCILAAALVFLFVDGRTGDLISVLLGAAIGVWTWIKKSFEKKIKKQIMPTLMQAFPGFHWQETPPVTASEIIQCNILPDIKDATKKFDDCFVGNYREVPIAVSECKIIKGSGKNSKTIFEGVCIKIKMNKKFENATVIRPKNISYLDLSPCADLKKLKLEEVKLEDPEFEKKYYVYSSDQIEARYLITTSFMERLKQIQKAFASEYTYCAFYGDSVYIAPHTGCDLFSLCSLTKEITNTEQFAILLDEFVSILNLVDHFKLDKKLGL